MYNRAARCMMLVEVPMLPTDRQVKAAAWELFEAACQALACLEHARDRSSADARAKLRAAILAAGGEVPSGRDASEQAWDRLRDK